MFSITTGYCTLLGYELIFFYVLRALPKSFTIGEASILVQGFILLMFNAVYLLVNYTDIRPSTDQELLSAILLVSVHS